MSELQETLEETDREIIVQDVVELIDEEVGDKGGLTGMALKTGYNAVKKLDDGQAIDKAVDSMLDEFTEALAPLYDDYQASDRAESFGEYLDTHEQRATEALLSITDGRAEHADNKFLKKTYSKLRGQAEKHVTAALPRVGKLIDKHTAQS